MIKVTENCYYNGFTINTGRTEFRDAIASREIPEVLEIF